MDWKPVTWPSPRQGGVSTLLTIFPGQEAGGGSEGWPRTTTRNGAESASRGAATATRAASRQAPATSRDQARRAEVLVSAIRIFQATRGTKPSCGANLAVRPGRMRRHGRVCTIPVKRPGRVARAMEASSNADEFIPAALAAYGVEAD